MFLRESALFRRTALAVAPLQLSSLSIAGGKTSSSRDDGDDADLLVLRKSRCSERSFPRVYKSRAEEPRDVIMTDLPWSRLSLIQVPRNIKSDKFAFRIWHFIIATIISIQVFYRGPFNTNFMRQRVKHIRVYDSISDTIFCVSWSKRSIGFVELFFNPTAMTVKK